MMWEENVDAYYAPVTLWKHAVVPVTAKFDCTGKTTDIDPKFF